MIKVNEFSKIYDNPAELLQFLIRFNTTNPPGNERECVLFINDILKNAGIETKILARTPERPNLIAKIKGKGNKEPFLLYGHVDVVTTENQKWDYPPFEGKIVDGYVWGRGALDMKGGVSMMLSAFLKIKAENIKPQGDIIITIVPDEEAGGDFGAKWLVENHKELFKGVRYAIGEFGGFTLTIGGKRFYPIQISEKQISWIKAKFRGPGGHASMPVKGGAMAKLSRFLKIIDEKELPVHITEPARLMIGSMADALGGMKGFMLRRLLNPSFTDKILNILGENGSFFKPLLHNTVSPTILHGSDKINVIPPEVSVELDGRILPGFKPDDLIKEIKEIVGEDIEIEVIRYDEGPSKPDMGLFKTLSYILKEFDPEGIPIPLLLGGVTDGRFFSKLGIQTYGFLPMQLPEDFNFAKTIHSANERIPVRALEFGRDAIFKLLKEYR